MPRDKHGNEIKVGDEVLVRARVLDVDEKDTEGLNVKLMRCGWHDASTVELVQPQSGEGK